jgi:hypothetical protein
MTGRIIDAVTGNLRRLEDLVRNLDQEVYANEGIAPYYSSIGAHVRHILDIFARVADGVETGTVDLTDRRRGTPEEREPERGLTYLATTQRRLEALRTAPQDRPVTVTDDLGQGPVATPYTLGAALCQAHSHAIHHFACIGYLLNLQGLPLPTEGFGVNPTTPLANTAP